MSLIVIAAFFFVPILSLVSIQMFAARVRNLTVSRKPYATGSIFSFVALMIGLQILLDSWAGVSDPPAFNTLFWTRLLSPSIISLVVVLGVAHMLKLRFSRKAYLAGWLSGLAGALGTVWLFYWYFNG
ncbi:hypothetical protein [Paraburkholderia sp. J8-2]|uniref:hypothetical protein n=1 Tax=Paraburkholderia sp. J8-2 TaxID=2805440 RepID=UPI002AB6D00A|nr:hypothetical protein [Paraburkholderia sp. J8-2]